MFVNIRTAFVTSSSAQSAQRPPLGVGKMEWDTAAARAASAQSAELCTTSTKICEDNSKYYRVYFYIFSQNAYDYHTS